jgi:hypothetical protein
MSEKPCLVSDSPIKRLLAAAAEGSAAADFSLMIGGVAAAARVVQEGGFWPLAIGCW